MEKRNRSGQGEGFFKLYHRLMDSDDFLRMSGSALKVYLHIARQYVGGNNGNLTACYREIKEKTGLAKDTIKKALDELDGKGFIYQTAMEHFPTRDPARYAILKPSLKMDYPRGCNNVYVPPVAKREETQRGIKKNDLPDQKLGQSVPKTRTVTPPTVPKTRTVLCEKQDINCPRN